MARTERGAAAVELAIVFPILFLIIAGMVDLSRLYFYQIQVTNAAREGARAAVVGGLTDTQIKDRAKVAAGAISPADITFPGFVPCGTDSASVTVRASFTWLILGPAVNIIGGSWAPRDSVESTAVMKCGG